MVQHTHCYNRPLTVHGTSCHFPWPWLLEWPSGSFTYCKPFQKKIFHTVVQHLPSDSTSCGPAVTAELLVWLVVQFDQCNTTWPLVVLSSSTPLLFPIFFPSTFLHPPFPILFPIHQFSLLPFLSLLFTLFHHLEEFAVIQSKPRTATA